MDGYSVQMHPNSFVHGCQAPQSLVEPHPTYEPPIGRPLEGTQTSDTIHPVPNLTLKTFTRAELQLARFTMRTCGRCHPSCADLLALAFGSGL